MNRVRNHVSIGLILGLLVSVLTAMPVFAADGTRIELPSSHGGYVIVSNVVESRPEIPLYIANAPATVHFYGEDLAMERIEYYPTAEVKGEDITLPESPEGTVQFDVKQYTYYGETEVHDELVEEALDVPHYLPGNYATLSKPGFYLVMGLSEAGAAPDLFVVQVLGQEAGEAAPIASPEPVTAVPTASKVLVNGEEVSFEAYNINGNNFFKLRDLALAVSGTEKQFEVTWDGEKNAISLVSGKAYTPVGGELAVSAELQAQIAAPTASQIFVDGVEVQFTAHNIGGNNYFKLRDIAKVMGFGVTWDAETSTVGIDTSKPYTE